MKKIKVLFDGGVIYRSILEKSQRTGVFFATYNILREFLKCDDLDVEIFLDGNADNISDEVLEQYPEFIGWKIARLRNTKIHVLEQRVRILRRKNKREKGSKIVKMAYTISLFFLKNISRMIPVCPKEKYDVYLSTMYKLPDFAFRQKNAKRYTIIYDATPLIFPEYFQGFGPNHWFVKLAKSINKKDYYFAISESTKNDFKKYTPKIDPDKITVALLAAGDNFYPVTDAKKIEDAKQKYNIPINKKYILSLCSLEPRKNLIRTATAFIEFIKKNNIDDFVFVLGGNAWKGFVEKMEAGIPNFDKYRDKIIRAGYVDDVDLAALYSGAEFFVYTSEYEGFGLPPLEAMQCGCAVITSNNSSLPEVVGDAGIMIDFDSITQHVDAFEKLYFDCKIREKLKKKSLKRASDFSWKKCADIMIKKIISDAS